MEFICCEKSDQINHLIEDKGKKFTLKKTVCVIEKMVDLLQTKQEDSSNSVVTNQNAENASEIDEQDVAVNSNENTDKPLAKKLKLQMPTFLKRKLNADWKSLPHEQDRPKQDDAKLGIEFICPNICFSFLRDECVEGDSCLDLHEFPSNADIIKKLTECDAAEVLKLLQVIIARNQKLLHHFFRLFVEFFAAKRLKTHLIDALCICERERDKNKQFELLQHLIQALIQSGETYTGAMTTIFQNMDQKNCDIIDSLLNIKLVDGIGVDEFLSVFRSLNDQHYRFNAHIINRLMYLCTQSEDTLNAEVLREFTQIIFNILKQNEHVRTSIDKTFYNCYVELRLRIQKKSNFC